MRTTHSDTSDLTASLTDRDLLRRFVQDADEAAFAEIVWRYQGLVISVCRRVIGDSPDIDDAFQATFLTLARRPRQICKAESLSSWLYSVAWRTSVRLVRQRKKQIVPSLPEQTPGGEPGPLEQITADQDSQILDEELNALPPPYRDVLVMTYFADQTSQQIADQFNVSKGTIDGRIRQARNQLRVRLARRGVALGVLATVASLTTESAAAAVSEPLLTSTIDLGIQTVNGTLPETTDVSHLEPLIRTEITMFTTKTILASVIGICAVVGLAGLSGAANQREGDGAASAERLDTVDESADLAVGLTDAVLDVVAASDDSDSGPAFHALVDLDTDDVLDATFVEVGAVDSGNAGGPFKPYPADARPVEKWMYEILDEPVPQLDYPGEAPLSEVLSEIAEYYTVRHGGDEHFRLTIWPDYAELNLEGLTSLEDVTVRDIMISNLSLRNALHLIFEQTTEPELTYVIANEVMQITSRAKAESAESTSTRVYPLGKLEWFGTEDLVSLVKNMTATPDMWIDENGEERIQLIWKMLVVRQTPAVHEAVADLLNKLAAANDE